MVRMGLDEDRFLLGLAEVYGPVVYLPWPLQQYFVLDADVIERVYDTPVTTLGFATIRREMQGDVFGSSKGVWKNEALLDGEVFPLHSRGMVKGKMEAPLARFVAAIEERVDVLGDEVDDAAGGELELSLVDWVKTTVHGASIPTLFGPSFASHANLSPPQLQATLEAFDAAFPLLASGLVPAFLHPLIPPIAKGLRARDELSKAIATWILDDLPGLEEGVVRDMTAACLDAGHPASEAAKLVIGNIWALTANSPSAAVWMLLYVLQSGDLLDDILAEIDLAKQQPPTLAHLSSSMPLVASCLTETLRTSTSTLSIRTVERDFFLSTLPTSSPDADTKGPGSTTQGYLLPAGSRVIAATRMAHVSKKVWGEDAAEWDGRRFWDREGEEAGVRSRKARLVHGYGGGVSMCEGRHLAALELKAFMLSMLSTFEITLLHPVSGAGIESNEFRKLRIAGQKDGMGPKLLEGRVGMGVYQWADSDIKVKVKRRNV